MTDPETWHVIPVQDFFHIEAENCICSPTVEKFENGNKVVVHNEGRA